MQRSETKTHTKTKRKKNIKEQGRADRMLRSTAMRGARSTTEGMSTTDIVRKHCYKTWGAQRGWNPLNIVRAEGCWFHDDKGKAYLDMSSQVICSTLGHQNAAVTESLVKQARELAFVGPGFAFETRAKAVSKLLEVVPEGIDKFFFPTSGTAAVESAIKMARSFTGKRKIVARYNTYHGGTHASMQLTSDWRRYMSEAQRYTGNEGVIYIPEVNSYRTGPLGYSADAHMANLEYIFQNEPDIAAVILEPVVGSNGILVPPPDYWPKLRALTKKHGVLLIADEVMAAWGRTGYWFAVDRWNVTPDILTTAKGITNSVQPLGMVATTREVANHFEDNVYCNGHTFESHPMTLAPAVAAIDEYRRLNLIEYSRVEGEKLGAKLRGLLDRHPSVGDVRGTGMFWCVDLVKNRATKEPFATNVDKAKGKPCPVELVAAKMMQLGVYCITHVNHLNVAPPLIITEKEMDIAVAAFDEALKITDAMVQH